MPVGARRAAIAATTGALCVAAAVALPVVDALIRPSCTPGSVRFHRPRPDRLGAGHPVSIPAAAFLVTRRRAGGGPH
ncbi:MAG: hypothetical protein ACRDJU_13480, partial [Actinomycetota bacterium]